MVLTDRCSICCSFPPQALGSVGLDLLVPRIMGIIMDILIYPNFMLKEADIFDIVC